MEEPIVYVNVDTQTSFTTTTTMTSTPTSSDDESTPRQELNNNNQTSQHHLETIHERSQDCHSQDEEEQEPRYENQPKTETNPSDQHQLNVLRDLLRLERQKNQQRKLNNNSMQQYLNQLQAEYLNLQRELVETLELGHKIKAQKEAQIGALDETLREKNRLIEQLRQNLLQLDESRVRSEFKELMEKQSKLFQLEKEQLREQIENTEQQMMRERINSSQILQQFQTKLEELMRSHESETAGLKGKLNKLENDYDRLLHEPQNMIIKNLREEKSQLSCQLDELSLVLNESQSKYERLGKRIECLLSEQEQIESKNQSELEEMQLHCAEQRRAHNELKLKLEDRDEVIQIVQFNLQRSEKRVKNLLNALKGKEEAYNELIGQVNSKHEQENDKLTGEVRSLERKLIDCQSELDRKQNEVMKLELERDNRLESMRNDRDERLMKANQEKNKLEKELKKLEVRFAHEFEDKECKSKLVEQYQKELQYFKEESKRLSLELSKTGAQLFSKQRELKNLSDSKEELAQQDRAAQQLESMQLELTEAQRHAKRLADTIGELKTENDKLRMKLKVNEANLSKINASISREHAKMLHDYENRLDEIKSEQSIYDKNKIKYKRYGHKLKKYCEHLRQVHEHMCNPTVCGYSICPTSPSSMNITRHPTCKTNINNNNNHISACNDYEPNKENRILFSPKRVL